MSDIAPGTVCLIVGLQHPDYQMANGRLVTVVGLSHNPLWATPAYEIEADWIPGLWPRFAERRNLVPILPPEDQVAFIADLPLDEREAA